VARGEAAIGCGLARRLSIEGDVTLQHRQEPVGLSAGLPVSITRSRIMPLLPEARLSLWQYSTSRLPLMMMSACG
jgi:hypothetical protein